MAHAKADMTKSEFIGKIEKELYRFIGRWCETAIKLRFAKGRNEFRIFIMTNVGCHKIFIGKKYIKFTFGKSRFFADRRFVYYKWYDADNHQDVINKFVDDIKVFNKDVIFSNKDGRHFVFYDSVQSYPMQHWIDLICDR